MSNFNDMKECFSFIEEARKNEQKASSTKSGGIYPRIDCFESKQEILKIANRYLLEQQEQTPQRTDEILTALLDIEIYPLQRELFTQENKPRGFLSGLQESMKEKSSVRARMVVALIRLSFFSIKMFFLYLPFIEVNFITITLFVFSAISVVGKILANLAYQISHTRFSGLLSLMNVIRNEIASCAYSPSRICERLTDLESKGGYVYSIVYSLLDIKKKQISEN